MSAAIAGISEYEAIAATIQHYIEGAKTGKGAAMKPAFHRDATIQGYFEGELFAGPIQLLFDYVDQDKPASGLKWRIASVDIAGTLQTHAWNWMTGTATVSLTPSICSR